MDEKNFRVVDCDHPRENRLRRVQFYLVVEAVLWPFVLHVKRVVDDVSENGPLPSGSRLFRVDLVLKFRKIELNVRPNNLDVNRDIFVHEGVIRRVDLRLRFRIVNFNRVPVDILRREPDCAVDRPSKDSIIGDHSDIEAGLKPGRRHRFYPQVGNLKRIGSQLIPTPQEEGLLILEVKAVGIIKQYDALRTGISPVDRNDLTGPDSDILVADLDIGAVIELEVRVVDVDESGLKSEVSSVLVEEENPVVLGDCDDDPTAVIVDVEPESVLVVELLDVVLENSPLLEPLTQVLGRGLVIVGEAEDSQVEIEQVDDVVKNVEIGERQVDPENVLEDYRRGRARSDLALRVLVDPDVVVEGGRAGGAAVEEGRRDEVGDGPVLRVVVEHDFPGGDCAVHPELQALGPPDPLALGGLVDLDGVEQVVVLLSENPDRLLDAVDDENLVGDELEVEAGCLLIREDLDRLLLELEV